MNAAMQNLLDAHGGWFDPSGGWIVNRVSITGIVMQKKLNEKLEADYLRPASLETAVSALAAGPRVILAGGTYVFLDFKIDHC